MGERERTRVKEGKEHERWREEKKEGERRGRREIRGTSRRNEGERRKREKKRGERRRKRETEGNRDEIKKGEKED